MLSHITQCPNLIKTYNEKKDLYATIGTFIFKKDYWECMEHWEDGTPNPDGKALRSRCKQIVLGLTYGMGAKLMASNMGVSAEECKEMLDEFFKMFPEIKEFTKYNEECAKRIGYVEDYMGRRRHLPDAQKAEIEAYAHKEVITNADVLIDVNLEDCKIDIPDEELSAEWQKKWAEFEASGKFNAKKKYKELAEQYGIEVKDNGAFISKTMTQCTNARIQGCLGGDTHIWTIPYGRVPIRSVSGQSLKVWDGDGFVVADVVYSGKKRKCVIRFSNSSEIICSPNHLFATSKRNGKYEFTRCEDLCVGTLVCNDSKPKGIYVKSIEITDEYIDMYDVCDTERGYFVANGFIVHNSAATLTKKAMIAIFNDDEMRKLGFRILIPVHDELLGECPKENAEKVEKRLAQLMVQAAKPECTVDMKVDTYVVKHWYQDEVTNSIHKDYQSYIKGNEKKGIAPMSEEEAYNKICNNYPELSPKAIREMCDGTYDVLSEEI